jgi:hypothetical protein
MYSVTQQGNSDWIPNQKSKILPWMKKAQHSMTTQTTALRELGLGSAPSRPTAPAVCPGAGERRGTGGPPPDLWLLFSASWELRKKKLESLIVTQVHSDRNSSFFAEEM